MLALIRKLFAEPDHGAALPTYIALVEQARNQFFYDSMAVPDTLDGRFEMIVLHLFLLQHRLQEDIEVQRTNQKPAKWREGLASSATTNPHTSEGFSRSLSELFFTDMDRSVRELGVADTGVRYRIKAMAKAYHGRLQAYAASLADDDMLRTALARNLYGTVEQGDVQTLAQMADYVKTTAAWLKTVPLSIIMAGALSWPPMAATSPLLRKHG